MTCPCNPWLFCWLLLRHRIFSRSFYLRFILHFSGACRISQKRLSRKSGQATHYEQVCMNACICSVSGYGREHTAIRHANSLGRAGPLPAGVVGICFVSISCVLQCWIVCGHGGPSPKTWLNPVVRSVIGVISLFSIGIDDPL